MAGQIVQQNFYVWDHLLKRRQRRRQKLRSGRRRIANVQPAVLTTRRCAHFARGLIGAFEQIQHLFQKKFSLTRQHGSAPAPFQQCHAQLLLKILHLPAA